MQFRIQINPSDVRLSPSKATLSSGNKVSVNKHERKPEGNF